ncbi:putative ribonuclease H-like domain-containing protein [Tanacetum coccineum]|uniref:Ribonuclease H-like domain-containing protein n=1 Tax=Tanacetum coccineum TaxID=301880 RepID=A0ABQ5HJR5_9ASTR
MSKLFDNESESQTDESEEHNSPVKNRYKTCEGYHAVPPPYTGNYMPPRADLSFAGLDDSVYKFSVSESMAKTNETESNEEKLKTISEPVVIKPKVFNDAPLIKEWDSDSDDEDTKDVRSIWNYSQRVNHRNFSKKNHPNVKRNQVPKAALTVNAARQNLLRAAVTVNAARPIATADPKRTMNAANQMSQYTTQTHSIVYTPIQTQTTLNITFTTKRVKTVRRNVSAVKGNRENAVKSLACWIWSPTGNVIDHISKYSGSYTPKRFDYSNLETELEAKGIVDSGFSRHMIGNKSFLSDYVKIDGGFVAFGGDSKGGKITGKDTEYVVLSPEFKLPDENQVLLRFPRDNNMYTIDLKNIVPSGGLTCLFAKASLDESNLWHRRLGHINFKTLNKLVRGNLVRGLPSKIFENDHTCVACQKGKQHKASCKTKLVSSINKPLQLLHMDLFGPVSVRSIMHKVYCLVVTDDYSRFSWVFFLASKDETTGILKTFIKGIENQLDFKVKIIRSDNGTEFKNREMNQLCETQGIKREFNVAMTPQQNGVAERKNRTLIKAARTMLADFKLPTTF